MPGGSFESTNLNMIYSPSEAHPESNCAGLGRTAPDLSAASMCHISANAYSIVKVLFLFFPLAAPIIVFNNWIYSRVRPISHNKYFRRITATSTLIIIPI
jgi:hypothetical protein